MKQVRLHIYTEMLAITLPMPVFLFFFYFSPTIDKYSHTESNNRRRSEAQSAAIIMPLGSLEVRLVSTKND